MTDRKQRLFPSVQKPARYTGGEWGEVQKEKKDVRIRVAFCFPDTYEIGMSNLGMRILYGVMNAQKDVWCERVFAPWGDMEEVMRREQIPLWALESQDPVKDFDMIAFTIGYEMAYSNVLNMLSLSGVPLHSSERTGLQNMVFAGGVCTFNPEPLADFVDFFSLGEGEESTVEILDVYRRAKAEGWTKNRFLREVSKVPGVYVPSFYTPVYHAEGHLTEVIPNGEAPKTVVKRIGIMPIFQPKCWFLLRKSFMTVEIWSCFGGVSGGAVSVRPGSASARCGKRARLFCLIRLWSCWKAPEIMKLPCPACPLRTTRD